MKSSISLSATLGVEPLRDTLPRRPTSEGKAPFKAILLDRPLFFPPELLYMILAEVVASSIHDVFSEPPLTMDTAEDSVLPHMRPIPALLHVSHQFRETTFKVLRDALAIECASDGTLSRNAWASLVFSQECIHLSHFASYEAWRDHVRSGEHCFSDLLRVYLSLGVMEGETRALFKGPWDLIKMEECINVMHAIQAPLVRVRQQPLRWRIWRKTVHFTIYCTTAYKLGAIRHNMDVVLGSLRLVEGRPGVLDDETLESALRVVRSALQHLQDEDSPTTCCARDILALARQQGAAITEKILNRTRIITFLWSILDLKILSSNATINSAARDLLVRWLPIAMPRREPPLPGPRGPRSRRLSMI